MRDFFRIEMAPREAARPSQRHRDSGTRKHHSKRKSSSRKHTSTEEAKSGGSSGRQALSADALARLNDSNTRRGPTRDQERQRERERQKELQRERELRERREEKERRRRRESRANKVRRDEYLEVERAEEKPRRHHHRSEKRRVASGPVLEEGRARDWKWIRGGGSSYDSIDKGDPYYRPKRRLNKKRLCKDK